LDVSRPRQYLRRLDDDFLAGGPVARGAGVVAAVAAAVLVGGVVGLFAAVPLTALLSPAPSDYSVVAIPFGTTAVGGLLGGLAMGLSFYRKKKQR
jgi:membrane associated rhomboid family serine protease